jgi:hypothetical protein
MPIAPPHHGYLAADDRVLSAARSHFDQRSANFAIAVIRELGRRGMPQRESERDAEQATLDEFAGVAQREPGSTSPLAPTKQDELVAGRTGHRRLTGSSARSPAKRTRPRAGPLIATAL